MGAKPPGGQNVTCCPEMQQLLCRERCVLSVMVMLVLMVSLQTMLARQMWSYDPSTPDSLAIYNMQRGAGTNT